MAKIRHISTKNNAMSMKFGTKQQI